MTSHDTSNITISSMTDDVASQAFSLACDIFVNASALHTATGVSIEEYRQYMLKPFEAMREQGLSLIATDRTTNEIIGCIIACDYATKAQAPTETPDSLKPINALLQELDNLYQKNHRIESGECMLVDMAVVNPTYTGMGIYKNLREAAHLTGGEAGFKTVVGELSSAATQHLCINRFGHEVCAEVDFASFDYSGRKPFSQIKEPASIVLVEGALDCSTPAEL